MRAEAHILVVEDEPAIRFAIGSYLRASGFEVAEAATCEGARQACAKEKPDAVILDYALPDGNGIDLLRVLRRAAPAAPIFMLTGHGTIELAVSAIKHGATDLLTKPLQLQPLVGLLRQSLAPANSHQTRRDGSGPPTPERASSRWGLDSTAGPFVGTSTAMAELREQTTRIIKASDTPVLILGETGVGKGVLARWIHDSGPRAARPWVDINCAGLSHSLLESELFGHAKGAFTNAVAAKPGLFDEAAGGTLFLDELGDMAMPIQAKLLKVLEDRRFRRIGEVQEREVTARLITATHRDLAELGSRGAFRMDLYFRLTALPLHVPPLRARAEDIPMLAVSILEKLAAKAGLGSATLTEAAVDALQRHWWPGNVRELRNVLERALVMSDGQVIDVEQLRLVSASSGGPPPPSSRSRFDFQMAERAAIDAAMRSEGGRVIEVARKLGIPRSTLYLKLRRYGLATSKS